jgi:hydroxymethylbilane synthase
MVRQPVRIGTRASKLALIQAQSVRDAIAGALGDEAAAVLVRMTTSGDRIQDRTLTEIGGKGLFTAEIEAALIAGEIDCAVHSLKDMPTVPPPGLAIAAIPEREDARDAFVSARFADLAALPIGALLGTASLRRQAQVLAQRADLTVIALRGNVDTRLSKLERGEADAIVLAAAGLNRLGLGGVARAFVDPVLAPPAPGQGALAIQTRAADQDAPWLAGLRHEPTLLAISAERGALAALDGSCRTAVGAYGRIAGGRLQLTVQALSPDGRQAASESRATATPASAEAAWAFGLDVGAAVKARAGAFLSP